MNVEPYGGGLWHTWFDRDLSIAGRVILQRHDAVNGSNEPEDLNYSFEHRLVKIEKSILRVPNLCIHLRPADERDIFKINKESEKKFKSYCSTKKI